MDAGLTLDLRGARALITGGSRGIGRATAIMLAGAGARVGISYRSRREAAEETLRRIEAAGGSGWSEPVDLAAVQGADRLFERADREWGDAFEIFVANAGIWIADEVPLAGITDEQWATTIQVNLTGIFHQLRHAIRRISDGGSIVLVSSTAAQRGEAFHADYAASKGALVSMTKRLAVELAPRQIRVNCVAPGWVDTEMVADPLASGRDALERAIPLGRVATAEDVGGPIVFLCSPLARHITGEVLNVNGGSVLCG